MIKAKILILLISSSTLVGGFSFFHSPHKTLPDNSIISKIESPASKTNSQDNTVDTKSTPDNKTTITDKSNADKVATSKPEETKAISSNPTNNTKNTVSKQEENSSNNKEELKTSPQQNNEQTSPKENITTPSKEPTATTAPKASNTGSQSELSQIQTIIFNKVNQERSKAGVAPLSYSTSLQKFAIDKSKDMAVNNYFSHEDLKGNLESTYIKQAGINYSAWGENIAYVDGYSGAENIANTIMTDWMNSPGHRANILSKNFKEIGVGVYKVGHKYYATQEFLTP